MNLEAFIRDIPDFPRPGITYKDITPLLSHPPAFDLALSHLAQQLKDVPVDKIVGIESRGFIFGAALAHQLGVGFVPARKKGKLPFQTVQKEYDLEYGTDTLEIHTDAIREGENVVIHDDLLATGGTSWAAEQLVKEVGGTVVGFLFVIELGFLNGRERLNPDLVSSLITY